jgi:hypothetical protein
MMIWVGWLMRQGFVLGPTVSPNKWSLYNQGASSHSAFFVKCVLAEETDEFTGVGASNVLV